MMRKTPLILLGAAAGVAVTLIATQPRIMLDGARAQAAAADRELAAELGRGPLATRDVAGEEQHPHVDDRPAGDGGLEAVAMVEQLLAGEIAHDLGS